MPHKLKEEMLLPLWMIGFFLPLPVLGIFFFTAENSYIGILLIGLYLFLVTMKKGVEIDFENKKLNLFIRLFGMQLDNWEPSLNFKAYVIRRHVNISRSKVSWVNQYHKSEHAYLGLIRNNPFKPVILKIDDKEILLELGLQLEKQWELPRYVQPKNR